MARALMFKVGAQGMLCAAYEVEMIAGTQISKGKAVPYKTCTEPVDKVVGITGLCANHARLFVKDPVVYNAARIIEESA